MKRKPESLKTPAFFINCPFLTYRIGEKKRKNSCIIQKNEFPLRDVSFA